jgi:hypothetical protein
MRFEFLSFSFIFLSFLIMILKSATIISETIVAVQSLLINRGIQLTKPIVPASHWLVAIYS